jgi:exopolyphosphatase/guanosine-5'-triphosphate,3'-diphosphate pyrophosphatase
MKAAIDIGTNTVLLLIGEVEGGTIKVLHEEQRIPRLGKGVDEGRNLHPESIQRVLTALKEYKKIIESDFPEVEDVIVTATSAVRDAENRDEFMELVKELTGFEIRLLSGDEEAQWTFAGATSVVQLQEKESAFVLDIGGGSTELALGFKGSVDDFRSYDMGCVRFKERFLHHDPPYQEEIFECKEEIKYLLGKKKIKPPRRVKAIGVAGTATSLAAIDLQIEEYNAERLNGHIINRNKLTKSLDIFRHHTYEQLLELNPTVLKGREDIFLTGLLILEGFLNFYKIDEIHVSTGGIRHGAILLSEKEQN